jgi:hypothetical protein
MAIKASSLQDIIRQRQHVGFVGRQAHIAQFRENFALPFDHQDRRFVFSIHGVSGVGKTYLMRQLIQVAEARGAATAYTDESDYDLPSIMGALASDLAQRGVRLERFLKQYAIYQQRRYQLENDPNAPEGTPSFLTTTAVRIALATAKTAPVVGNVIKSLDLDDAAIAEQADRLRKYMSKKFRTHEIRLLLSPTEELTPIFAEGLRTASRQRILALFFDSYEHTSPIVDQWLTDLLDGRYGEFPSNAVITIVGQRGLDPNEWLPLP